MCKIAVAYHMAKTARQNAEKPSEKNEGRSENRNGAGNQSTTVLNRSPGFGENLSEFFKLNVRLT